MASVSERPSPVNGMDHLPLQVRLARDVAFYRAGQLLADATRCRDGLPPEPLTALNRHDKQWFLQTARQLIEIFETETQGPARDAAAAARHADQQQARAFEAELLRMRTHARRAAQGRGHDLGTWLPGPVRVADETATCTQCGRAAHLIAVDEALRIEAAGAALAEGCLVAVETPEVR